MRRSRAVAIAIVTTAFAVELAKATIATIRAAFAPTARLRPAILAIPLDVRTPLAIVVFADMVTLTPGTTSLAVSPDHRVLYVHCLDAPDPAAAIREMKESLEKPAMEL